MSDKAPEGEPKKQPKATTGRLSGSLRRARKMRLGGRGGNRRQTTRGGECPTTSTSTQRCRPTLNISASAVRLRSEALGTKGLKKARSRRTKIVRKRDLKKRRLIMPPRTVNQRRARVQRKQAPNTPARGRAPRGRPRGRRAPIPVSNVSLTGCPSRLSDNSENVDLPENPQQEQKQEEEQEQHQQPEEQEEKKKDKEEGSEKSA